MGPLFVVGAHPLYNFGTSHYKFGVHRKAQTRMSRAHHTARSSSVRLCVMWRGICSFLPRTLVYFSHLIQPMKRWNASGEITVE
jgi:hypothetical protein